MSSFRSSKVNKRQFKYLKSLASDLNVDIERIESNSLNILLGNVGLLTGNNYEDIYNLFSSFKCSIRNIFLFNNRRYSLVQFDSIESSIEAVNKLNGIYNQSIGKIIYLIQIADEIADQLVNQCQQNLLKQFSNQPEGLIVLEEMINQDEETMLLQLIDWSCDGKVEHLKNRKVKHFGRRFDYMVNGIVDDETIDPFPEMVRKLMTKWYNGQVIKYLPDQVTVNLYDKGQGIPMHIDTHSCCENEIVSLSLGSDIVMDFERIKSMEGQNCCSVLLKRRSLLIMKDEARYCWNHGIACRKFDASPNPNNSNQLVFNERSTRVSFTLRKSKNSDCYCDFTEFCDSQRKEMEIVNPFEMEDQYVYKVYDEIAGDFSRTRYKPWPRVKQFIDSLAIGSILCDIGCGNGKYLNLNSNIFNVGSDTSLQLLEICKNRQMEVIGSNILSLPFRSSSVDHLICIAVIHHLSSQERRVSSLREMTRILVPGGTGLVYVWALEQVKNGTKSIYIKTKGTERDETDLETDTSSNQSSLPVHCNRTEFKQQDLFVPWKDKNKEKQFLRYYHVFRENELENLFQDITNIEIIESYYDQGNWCVIFKKINN